MKRYILLIFALITTFCASAQKERKFIREGNQLYETGLKDTAKLDTISFGKAEVAYRRALELKPDDHQWQFNLADALYKQKKAEESAKEFENIAEKATLPLDKAKALHNMGNSFLVQKKLDESIASYKKALRIAPNDPETKYNLAYAMKMKKEEEKKKQQNKDQNKDQEKNKDQNKDKNKDQNKDQKKDQNQDKQNQNKDQDQKKDQQKDQQQQQNKISKQNAEQMLQALENDEKKTQEKVKKAQALKAEKRSVEKNW
jgi:tetratricopeptide (TPR) repeat protein